MTPKQTLASNLVPTAATSVAEMIHQTESRAKANATPTKTAETYRELVLRLESPIPEEGLTLTKEEYALVVMMLQALKDLGELADTVKRSVYYHLPFKPRVAEDAAGSCLDHLTNIYNSLRLGEYPFQGQSLTRDQARFLHSTIGQLTELGEWAITAFDFVVRGQPLNVKNVKEEGGDAGFYREVGFDVAGLKTAEVDQGNQDKLNLRYSKGQFSQQQALNRDVASEQKVLATPVRADRDDFPTQPGRFNG